MAVPDDLSGVTIQNYTIARHLARGGMADVYLAQNVRLQRDVVLKIMLPSFVENIAFVERFRREAQAMARLQHPNIVQVYDTGDTPDGRPFIAMQYIRGGTLEDLLLSLERQGQVMTTPFALAVARQVASALQVAHTAGIIHRDLKPSNILLDEQRRPVLTDLGIAYVQDSQRLTRTDTFIGTPHYMSPEQGKGLELDARSDIYSLGVVLFEMLTGQRPFPGDSHWALIHQHVSVPAPSLSKVRAGLPTAVSQIVARCLEKDPTRRYQSAAELSAALDRALAAEDASGSLSASGEWQWRSPQSGQFFTERAGRVKTVVPEVAKPAGGRLLIGLGALALVVVTAVIWLVTRSPEPPIAGPLPTQIIITQIVEVDREVTRQLSPSSTPAPTAVNAINEETPATVATTATETQSPTQSPAPSLPSSAGGEITARVISNVFTRQGPGMTFPQAGSLARDTVVPVLGSDRAGNWYVVQPPVGTPVWVSATFITAESGSLDDITPAATLPALPTATATAVPVAATNPPPGGGGGEGSTAVQPTITAVPTNTLAPEPTNTLAP